MGQVCGIQRKRWLERIACNGIEPSLVVFLRTYARGCRLGEVLGGGIGGHRRCLGHRGWLRGERCRGGT